MDIRTFITEAGELINDSAYYGNKASTGVAQLSELAPKYQRAFTNPSGSELTCAEIKSQAANLVEEINHNRKLQAFALAVESGDPMLYAATEFWHTTTATKIRKRDDGGGAVESMDITSEWKEIDLLELSKVVGSIGKDPAWIATAEKLNCAMTLQRARRNGSSADNLHRIARYFRMSDLARQVEISLEDPDAANPTSMTQLRNALSLLVTQMVGEEYHIKSADVNRLNDNFSKDDNKSKNPLGTKCPTNKEFVAKLHVMLHRIVTDGEYNTRGCTRKPRTTDAE